MVLVNQVVLVLVEVEEVEGEVAVVVHNHSPLLLQTEY